MIHFDEIVNNAVMRIRKNKDLMLMYHYPGHQHYIKSHHRFLLFGSITTFQLKIKHKVVHSQ